MRQHVSLFLTASFLFMHQGVMASSMNQDDDNARVEQSALSTGRALVSLDSLAQKENSPPKFGFLDRTQPGVQAYLEWRKNSKERSPDSQEPPAKRQKVESLSFQVFDSLLSEYICDGWTLADLRNMNPKDPSKPLRKEFDSWAYEPDFFSSMPDLIQKRIMEYVLANDVTAFKALRRAGKVFAKHSPVDVAPKRSSTAAVERVKKETSGINLRNLTWELLAQRTGDAAHFNEFHAPLFHPLPLHHLWYYLEHKTFDGALDRNTPQGGDYWNLPVNGTPTRSVLIKPLDTSLTTLRWENVTSQDEDDDTVKNGIRYIDVGHLTGLEELDIRNTNITRINGINNLSTLTSLKLLDNSMSDLSDIEKMMQLVSLTLEIPWEQIDTPCDENGKGVEIDLHKLTNLWNLDIGRLHPSFLKGLEFLTNLRHLTFSCQFDCDEVFDGIGDFPPVKLPHEGALLQSLDLSNTDLTRVPNIDKLTSLGRLYLNDADKLTSIDALDSWMKHNPGLGTLMVMVDKRVLDDLSPFVLISYGVTLKNKYKNAAHVVLIGE